MSQALGPKAMVALARIAAELGLDYGGIDFAVGHDGELLFFEANATMVIVPPPADAKWDYRRAAIARALDAARDLPLAKIRAGSSLAMCG
jgi:glutathione synthase/RimK-type ligase-like ATP-grasp enzyme